MNLKKLGGLESCSNTFHGGLNDIECERQHGMGLLVLLYLTAKAPRSASHCPHPSVCRGCKCRCRMQCEGVNCMTYMTCWLAMDFCDVWCKSKVIWSKFKWEGSQQVFASKVRPDLLHDWHVGHTKMVVQMLTVYCLCWFWKDGLASGWVVAKEEIETLP